MAIKLLITGGTIDKVKHPQTGELGFDKSHLPQMLKRSLVMADITIETLFLKDSLDLTDHDRAKILAAVQSAPESRIIISHGTDTMIQTAKYLAQNTLDKTIVLFGSMLPYSVQNSDALFNLGFAISTVQTQTPATYIAMNAQIFTPNNTQKNHKLGIFQTLSKP